jgi:hypothetical protein
MMVDIENFEFVVFFEGVCLGNLKKASFDMKTFANELCRFICESLGEKSKQGLVLSTMSPRQFTDYQWYFRE